MILCECGCGQQAKRRFVHGHNRTNGGFKHGHGSIFHRNPTYGSWKAMKARCRNPKHPAYARYSQLEICVRWEQFENFLADMGERPVGCTLGRIDNEKGYCKENCRWETQAQQAANKRRPRADSYPRNTGILKARKYIGPLRHNGNFFGTVYYRRNK